MAVDVSVDLERAYSDLREIDSDLAVITGRRGGAGGSLSDRINRKRPAPNFASRILFDGNERRVQEVGDGRRIRISVGNDINESGGRLTKRIRYSDTRNSREEISRDVRRESRINLKDEYDDDEDMERPVRRSVQSSVVMPAIETKSREVVLNEMKKKEKKEDVARNRNLFGRLLVGTLKQFQKEETAVKTLESVQAQKLKEVDKRLELDKKEDAEKVRQEKDELMAKRREKEKEIAKLKRVKAITQYAEEKVVHYKRLQNYIQTQTKPPLFYIPAKHTLRTLELLKNSSKKIDTLIDRRRDQMEKELKKDEEGTDDELDVGPVRSKVIAPRGRVDKSAASEEANASANIEDLEEPKLEEPMDDDEVGEITHEKNDTQQQSLKVREEKEETEASKVVESKVNGEKSQNKNGVSITRGSRSRSRTSSFSNGISSGSGSSSEEE